MRRPPASLRLVPIGLMFVLGLAPKTRAADAPSLDFNRDVRPILSEACFQCHGPDTAKRKAGLRLDTRDGAFARREAGPVLVPGKPEESSLVERITSDDPDVVMPPPKSGKTLTKAQVETLRRWVEQGAEYRPHWSYAAVVRPAVPDVSKLQAPDRFVRNDIDRFVLAGLASKGLTPSPEADRATLVRRLYLDLTGLPPTSPEVDAFVNDASPDAYEKLVGRIFASPHHGERLASWWLDLVRYADTTGYHGDNHRDVSLYRDWVINAFNTNLRFDTFTLEQLAGDLLPSPTDAQKVASGYNKMLMTTQEGGAQAKEYHAKYAADRVRNASTVWLGATLGCAECHDHKYDPFTTRDFYRFAAFFADIQEAAVGAQEQVAFPTPEQAAQVREIDAKLAALQKTLDTPTPELAEAQKAWETAAASDTSWVVMTPLKAVSEGTAKLQIKEDGSILATGNSPERDTYVLTFKGPKPALTGLRLEVLPDGGLPALGPGRAANGNFVLNELSLASSDGDGTPVAWSNASATYAQGSFAVAGAIDGKPETGWGVMGEAGRPNLAVFEAKEEFGPCCAECAEATLTLTLKFNYGSQHTLGRFRVAVTDAPKPLRASGLPSNVRAILATPSDRRSDAQRSELAAYHRSIAPSLQPTRDQIAAIKAERAAIEAKMPRTVITRAGAPRMTRILPRGNWLDDSGPEVTPSVPQFLKTSGAVAETAPRATRLDLARWVISPENPLTARVFVNRLWALGFGQGIVATPDDFGAQGMAPTHPELLDWLAGEFVSSGWDVRHVLRLIVTSGAYRQSSKADESLRQRDPYNQWLARQGRFRLDAEAIRDTALAVSGLLVRQVGGAPARPYQPAGYWSHLNFPKREYQPDHGQGLYRRGLYTYWCRTFLHPSLLAFDAPTREECTVQRPRSNTPIQALVLLNDPTYVEAARALAEKTIREGGPDDAGRVLWLYRNVLGRPARPAEAGVLTSLLAKHRDDYRARREDAAEIARNGERPAPADLEPVELAAWTSVARTLLNLHETITRY